MWSAYGRPSRREAIGAFIAGALGAGCRLQRAATSETADADAIDDVAAHYVRLTLQLGRHQPSLVEAWNGPAEWAHGTRRPVSELRSQIEALRSQLERVRPVAALSPRHRYLTDQAAALHVAARRLSGESMTFADEARDAMGVPSSLWRGREDEAAGARGALDALIPAGGDLRDRVNTFRRRLAIPESRLIEAFTAASEACRSHVSEFLALPAGEAVSTALAHDLAAEARATWGEGLRTEVAIDRRASPDVARLVWLAAHETYAGHHLQHILAVAATADAAVPIERCLHPAFGPHLLVAEGAAEAGAALLLQGSSYHDLCGLVIEGIGMSRRDPAMVIAVQRAMLDLDLRIPQIAEAYLDGRLGHEDAKAQLAHDALVPDPASLLLLIERWRSRVLAYPVGRRLVTRALGDESATVQWERLRAISTTLTVA